MKILITHPVTIGENVHVAGMVYDVSESVAKELIENNQAVPAEEIRAPRRRTRKGVEENDE